MNIIGHLFGQDEPWWFESSAGRAGRFDAVAVCKGRRVPVVGTRLAAEGLAFISSVKLRESKIPVTFTIRKRTIPSRVKIVKEELLQVSSSVMHRYFCAFTHLDEVDREVVVQYVADTPETEAPLVDARAVLSAQAQGRIADQLIKLKRLAPLVAGRAPLIRVDPGSVRSLGEGRAVRSVVVYSKRLDADGIRAYITRFNVFSDDYVEVVK